MIRGFAIAAILGFVTIFPTFEANDVQSLINAFDDDWREAFVQFQNDGNREGFVEVHFNANPGVLASCRKDGGSVHFYQSADLVSQVNEHWFLKVVNEKFFKSHPDGSFRTQCRRRLEIGFPRLNRQVVAKESVRSSCQNGIEIFGRSEFDHIEPLAKIDDFKLLFRFPFPFEA